LAMIPAALGAASAAGVVTFVVVGRGRAARGTFTGTRRPLERQLAARLPLERLCDMPQLTAFLRARSDAVRERGLECEATTAYSAGPRTAGPCGSATALAELPMVTHTAIGAARAMRVPLRVTLWLSA
jgi:hypothetical protein